MTPNLRTVVYRTKGCRAPKRANKTKKVYITCAVYSKSSKNHMVRKTHIFSCYSTCLTLIPNAIRSCASLISLWKQSTENCTLLFFVQVYKYTSVSKWWQGFHYWVNCSFNTAILKINIVGVKHTHIHTALPQYNPLPEGARAHSNTCCPHGGLLWRSRASYSISIYWCCYLVLWQAESINHCTTVVLVLSIHRTSRALQPSGSRSVAWAKFDQQAHLPSAMAIWDEDDIKRKEQSDKDG